MTVAELVDAGVTNVRIIMSKELGGPGTTTETHYGIRQVTDSMLEGYEFVDIDQFNMATYTV